MIHSQCIRQSENAPKTHFETILSLCRRSRILLYLGYMHDLYWQNNYSKCLRFQDLIYLACILHVYYCYHHHRKAATIGVVVVVVVVVVQGRPVRALCDA